MATSPAPLVAARTTLRTAHLDAENITFCIAEAHRLNRPCTDLHAQQTAALAAVNVVRAEIRRQYGLSS